jgi:hypothetical protein
MQHQQFQEMTWTCVVADLCGQKPTTRPAYVAAVTILYLPRMGECMCIPCWS